MKRAIDRTIKLVRTSSTEGGRNKVKGGVPGKATSRHAANTQGDGFIPLTPRRKLMRIVNHTLRTGLAAALLLAGITTAAPGFAPGGMSPFGGGSRGMTLI